MSVEKYSGVKEMMCDFIKEVKKDEEYTYEDIMGKYGLTRSQLYNILKKKGEAVSVELIHKVVSKMGYGVKIMFYRNIV